MNEGSRKTVGTKKRMELKLNGSQKPKMYYEGFKSLHSDSGKLLLLKLERKDKINCYNFSEPLCRYRVK